MYNAFAETDTVYLLAIAFQVQLYFCHVHICYYLYSFYFPTCALSTFYFLSEDCMHILLRNSSYHKFIRLAKFPAFSSI